MSTLTIQETIVGLVWGSDGGNDTSGSLSKFLEECAHEFYVLGEKIPRAACSIEHIAMIIDKLKSEAPILKSHLLPQAHENSDNNAAIVDCVVRMIFMTAAKTNYTVGGGFVTFSWRESETILDFMDRVYPRGSTGQTQDLLVNIRNTRVCILMKIAGIQIQPTNKLSDHLHLIYGDDFKTLLVFHHRSFLEFSLQRLKNNHIDLNHSTAEALRCGCLNPQLLIETLRTLDLIFPPFGDAKSKRFLESWVSKEKLDRGLLGSSLYPQNIEQPPKDLHGLYEQYPYWGRQLARLLREVDDPTPITWWQKYTERGRSPRRMFECAIVALMVTAFSALVATILAAVQVWITYCDWDAAPSRSWCSAKGSSTTNVTQR